MGRGVAVDFGEPLAREHRHNEQNHLTDLFVSNYFRGSQCSHDENFAFLNQTDDGSTAAKLANPKTIEYQVVRTTLLPGLLKTINANRMQPLPLRVFECSDIVLKDDALPRRAINKKRFAALYCGKTGSGFEVLHGFMDRMMRMMHAVPVLPGNGADKGARGAYWLEESESGFGLVLGPPIRFSSLT